MILLSWRVTIKWQDVVMRRAAVDLPLPPHRLVGLDPSLVTDVPGQDLELNTNVLRSLDQDHILQDQKRRRKRAKRRKQRRRKVRKKRPRGERNLDLVPSLRPVKADQEVLQGVKAEVGHLLFERRGLLDHCLLEKGGHHRHLYLIEEGLPSDDDLEVARDPQLESL